MLNALMDSIRRLEVKREIHPKDTMYYANFDWHYYSVGRSAITAIGTALSARLNYHNGSAPIRTILDFGCGYGRVARYLRVAFPEARIVANDFEKDGAIFCASAFGCESSDNPISPDTYDLIWLGSVFTHLPEKSVSDLLDELTRSLRPNGVLLFTSQGRYSLRNIEKYLALGDNRPKKAPYNLKPETLDDLVAGYYQKGFGFVDYPRQSGYGIAIITPEWLRDHVLSTGKMLQILWQEKGWDAHQDVSAFIRADLDDTRKSNF
jgi:SAM-dependent methyltransferase